VKIEVKTRKRYPQQYLMYEAIRYYSDKDSEFIKSRISHLLARILAGDAELRSRGGAILSPGTREALAVVYYSHTPAEKRVRRGGKGYGKEESQAGE